MKFKDRIEQEFQKDNKGHTTVERYAIAFYNNLIEFYREFGWNEQDIQEQYPSLEDFLEQEFFCGEATYHVMNKMTKSV